MYDLKLSVSLRLENAENPAYTEALIKAGIDTVDIDLVSTWKEPYETQQSELEKLEQRIERLAGLGIGFNAVHVSFGELWCLCSDDEEKRVTALKRTLDVCRRVSKYGVKIAVVHTNGRDFPLNKDRAAGIAQLRKSLTELSASSPLTIAVENLPRNCLGNTSGELLSIIDGIDVKIACDVNHFLQEKPQDAVRKFGGKIITTHISDYDGTDERHWMPGEGIIEWQKVIAAFEDIGYSGAFNYEVIVPPEGFFKIAGNKKNLFRAYNKLR